MSAIETEEEYDGEQEIRRLLELAKVKLEGPLLRMPLTNITKSICPTAIYRHFRRAFTMPSRTKPFRHVSLE
jgi:hypothetical protein